MAACEAGEFDDKVSSVCETKTQKDPVFGLTFVMKLSESHETEMAENQFAVLLHFVVRIIKAMDFGSCDRSVNQVRAALKFWGGAAAAKLDTALLDLQPIVREMFLIILVQDHTLSLPLFMKLLRDPHRVLLGEEQFCIEIILKHLEKDPKGFFLIVDRVLELHPARHAVLASLGQVILQSSMNQHQIVNSKLWHSLLNILKCGCDPAMIVLSLWVLVILLPHLTRHLACYLSDLLFILKRILVRYDRYETSRN